LTNYQIEALIYRSLILTYVNNVGKYTFLNMRPIESVDAV